MRKTLSILLTLCLFCGLLIGVSNRVLAAEEPECIDGSYLTDDESSEVTVGPLTRGVYLKSGSSSIVKQGTGKIAAGGNTIGQTVVSKISVGVIVERLVNGRWQAYTSWTATKYDSAVVSTSKVLTVPTGYYYRTCCNHYANSDSSGSYTDGIYI
ncbi:MAG: hypothetical protein HFG41_11840 [Coprococcus sp.]|nr:hypothetical protein [Coprococcus sp.]